MNRFFKILVPCLIVLTILAAMGTLSLLLEDQGTVETAWTPFVWMLVMAGVTMVVIFVLKRRRKRAWEKARATEMERERVRAEHIMQELWADEVWKRRPDIPKTPEPSPVTEREWEAYLDNFSSEKK